MNCFVKESFRLTLTLIYSSKKWPSTTGPLLLTATRQIEIFYLNKVRPNMKFNMVNYLIYARVSIRADFNWMYGKERSGTVPPAARAIKRIARPRRLICNPI